MWWPDIRGQAYSRRRVHSTLTSPVTTAGDQTKILGGGSPPFAYSLGWRALTQSELGQLLLAYERGGSSVGGYWLEWRELAESNLEIGVGTGSGILVLDLQGKITSGLTITRDGTPIVDWSMVDAGVEDQVSIDASANLLDAVYRASWTAGRRRRFVVATAEITSAPRGNTNLYTASLELVTV